MGASSPHQWHTALTNFCRVKMWKSKQRFQGFFVFFSWVDAETELEGLIWYLVSYSETGSLWIPPLREPRSRADRTEWPQAGNWTPEPLCYEATVGHHVTLTWGGSQHMAPEDQLQMLARAPVRGPDQRINQMYIIGYIPLHPRPPYCSKSPSKQLKKNVFVNVLIRKLERTF